MGSLTENMDHATFPSIIATILGVLSAAGLFRYLSPGNTVNNLGRLGRTLRSVIAAHIWVRSIKQEDNINDGENLVLNRRQIETLYSHETWQRQSYEALCTVLLPLEYGTQSFPCPYATKGLKSHEQRYLFVPSDNPSEPRNVRRIAAALRQYLEISRSCGPNTTLVMLCPPSDPVRSMEQYNLEFWGLLHGLRVLDDKPWPADVPADTKANTWAFCFDGVPWFPTVFTPAHARRRSRYMPVVTYVLQPKWIFDALFSTPEKRLSACTRVRKMVTEFDDVPLSPEIAHFGELGTSESRQYYLLDENEPSVCPYAHLI
ncbi:YqcI/YcgG family-domain-containing protein [Xylariales sp. PMI_506]|nr:YqcI/YcgG family-domain-containing protein [Xylariales sp. PMI_506]